MIKGLPERLQALRLQYRFSQKTVAQKLNISPSIVSAYEAGERTPSTDILLALAYLYNCSTDYLLGKQAKEQKTINVSDLTDEQARALQVFLDTLKSTQ